MDCKLDMYVYSGTGNTYRVAESICMAANERGMSSKIHMIDIRSKPKEFKPDNEGMLGLMAPTIGTIQPLSFFKFILRLPKNEGMPVFLVGTGAWTKLGPLFIPGFIGFGLYLAALILLLKGYKVVGIEGFGMPHNWTTLIPPYWKKLEVDICKEIEQKAKEFGERILSGKKVYKRIGDLIFGIILFPVPILFILVGHLFLAKTMFAGFRCNGCGLCERNCPRQAIKMKGAALKKPYWTFKCEQCMRCAGFCPQKALEGSYLIIIVNCIIFFAFRLDALLINAITSFTGMTQLTSNGVLTTVVSYIYLILTLWLVYAVFYLLNRIPLLNRVFTYMTLTFYWRKYKEPSTSIKKIGISNF